MKNEGNVLPLAPGSHVNAFGAGALVFRLGCLGAGKINPRYGIRVKEGIEKYSSLKLNEELYRFYMHEKNILPPDDVVNRARELSDTALVFITRVSSEARDIPADKGGYYLTDEERELVRKVSENFDKVVAVLNVAHPIEMGWVEQYGVDAVLWTGLSGMAGGRSLAEILEGSVNPSGRLPNTWAWDYHDYPSSRNFLTRADTDAKTGGEPARFITTVYEEGLYVGYRYFDSFRKPAAYMFGHGLSYTAFKASLKSAERTGECGARFEIEVKNTGERAGKEVVLLYAHFDGGALEQPDKRLVAFAKTKKLLPGESEVLHLEVSERRLKSYSEQEAAWIIEPGTVTFLLGGAPDKAKPVWAMDEEKKIVISRVKNRLRPPFPVKELTLRDPEGSFPRGELTKAWTERETGGKLPFKVTRTAESLGFVEPAATLERLIRFPELPDNPELIGPVY